MLQWFTTPAKVLVIIVAAAPAHHHHKRATHHHRAPIHSAYKHRSHRARMISGTDLPENASVAQIVDYVMAND